MKNSIKVVSTPGYVSANWNHPQKFTARGTISADLLDQNRKIWWISRAVINPKEYRNQGIGSILLRNVIDAIKKLDGYEICVIPGGYEQNTEKQYNFYRKNGFISYPHEQNSSLVYYIKRRNILLPS